MKTENIHKNPPALLKCKQCEYASYRMYDLRRHQQRHTKIKPAGAFNCTECSFVSKFKRNVKRHMLTHNKTPPMDATDNPKLEDEEPALEYISEPALEEYFVEPALEEYIVEPALEEYIVELIDRSESEPEEDKSVSDQTVSDQTVNDQTVSDQTVSDQVIVTEVLPCPELFYQKRFNCSVCNYGSNRAFDLRRHEQTHERVKAIDGTGFSCPQCAFVTKWKRNMRRHMQKHIKEDDPNQEASVSEDEGEQEDLIFSEEYILKLISDENSDTQSAENATSGNSETPKEVQRLANSETLNENQSKSIKRFQCTHCNYATNRSFDLRRHMKKHNRVAEVEGLTYIAYKCNKCTFITKFKHNIMRHMDTAHNPIETPNKSEKTSLEEQTFGKFLTVDKNEEKYQNLEIETLESDDVKEILPSYWVVIPANYAQKTSPINVEDS